MKYTVFHQKGEAALMLVIITLFVGLLITASFVFLGLTEARLIKNLEHSTKSYYVAEGGVEDLLLRSRTATLRMPSSPSTLVVGEGSATRTITSLPGGKQQFISEGNVSNRFRKVSAVQTVVTDDVNFFYGIQVDDGGLEMENNATVNGSVYSNGDIVGSPGAAITADAIVAGKPYILDANWETQNADFSFGYTTTGVSITTVDSTGDVGKYASIAMSQDGFARIAYYNDTNDDLKFVRCTNADCTTKVITIVDSTGNVGTYISLALGGDGFARISYIDETNEDLKFVRCLDADCTTKNITTVDSNRDIEEVTSITIGSDGFARISYYHDDDDDLKFARCTNADCTTKNITIVDAPNNVGDFSAIAMGSDELSRIAYWHDTNADVQFARCTNTDCTAKVLTLVDSSGAVGEYIDVAMASDGFARMSYYATSTGGLKFARCLDADCATKNITTVDVGQYTSIALGSDEFARIAYYNHTNHDLKFVRCTHADCTTKIISTVDSNGDMGKYASIAMSQDGFARIAYYNATNGDLKFARCLSDDCSPSLTRADVAQSFRLSTTSSSGRASLYLKKVGNPPDLPVRIVREAGGPGPGGRPGNTPGDILASGTLSAASVTASYSWVDVNFTSNSVLSSGTTYWLMADGGVDNSNYWVWGGDNANGYTNGTAKYSSDWTIGTWYDLNADLDFRIWIGGGKIDTVTIGNATTGTGRAQQFSNTSIHGSPCPNQYCIVESSPRQSLPVTAQVIQDWKDIAEAGGVIAGNYSPPSGTTTSLGPVKITGNLNLINNQTIIVTGTIWVAGNIDIDNGATVRLDPRYGAFSGILLADGWIHVKNNSQFQGSGQTGSYLMVLTTNNCTGSPLGTCTHHNAAIDLHNNATGAIFYAGNGLIFVHQNVVVSELVGYKIHLEQNAQLFYEQGLANAVFTGGPPGGLDFLWEEIE